MSVQMSKGLLEDLYWKQGHSLSKIGKLLGAEPYVIHYQMKKHNIPRRLSDRKNYPKFRFSGNLIEKSYLIGLRTGDLYAKRHYRLIKIETTSPNASQLKMFKKAFEKYGNVVIKERKGGYTETTKRIYCFMDNSFDFLVNKLESIPNWILKNNSLFYSFLAGYCDAEASWIITKHKKYNGKYTDLIFSLGTCDKIILEQIHQKLKELGFVSHLYMVRKRGIYDGRICNFDLYRVMIMRIKDVIKLAKILSPLSLHEEKQEKMQEMIKLGPLFKKSLSLEIPCKVCGHKLWKCGFSYNKKYQRYKCPICNKYFLENKLNYFGWLRNKEIAR